MANLLTAIEMKVYIETDLTDAALDRLIDAADQEIVQSHGEHASVGTVTELHIGGDAAIFLNRPPATITSVTETVSEVDTVLSTDDFREWYGSRVLQRLDDGTNPQTFWGERVSVVYTPISDDPRRIQATIDLTRLGVEFNALRTQRAGDYSQTALTDYTKERSQIVNSLGRSRWMP